MDFTTPTFRKEPNFSAGSQFQSTPSAWRETKFEYPIYFDLEISIHSLRMEGDSLISAVPDGETLFQSTPSAWRETSFGNLLYKQLFISIHSLRMEGDVVTVQGDAMDHSVISIHSLRMEGDSVVTPKCCTILDFNPLPPHGGRPCDETTKHVIVGISIHSLRMEGDLYRSSHHRVDRCISIHSLRMEGDRRCIFCLR